MLRYVIPAAVAACLAGGAQAASVVPTFTNIGSDTTNATDTGLFRADLSGLGLERIASITITDDGAGTSGTPGAYSGFDLDAIFLDVDGDATTLGDQIAANAFAFAAGTLRAGGSQASNTAGALNGSASDTAVDEAFATLGTIDAIFFGTGSISLGDGGGLTALFAPDVVVGETLFLFVGEVANNGETIDGRIAISDTVPAVPLPASGLLLAGALGLLAARRRGRP